VVEDDFSPPTHKHKHTSYTPAHKHTPTLSTHTTHTYAPTHTFNVVMSNASTAKPPAKRVRIDHDTPPVYDYTPIAGSVSTLLPDMKEFVQHYHDKFIKTSKQINDKNNIIKK
jgi:hypothetical protein